MAIAAIVRGRRMLPQERPALLGVAAVTGLVDGVLDQQLRRGRSMRVVAIRAGHLAVGDRMGRQVMRLGTLRLVAGKADFALGDSGQRLVLWLMHFVAGSTGHVTGSVSATRPMTTLPALVAVQAGAGLHFGRRAVRAAEHKIRRRPLRAATSVLHMGSARTVAGLATGLRGDSMAGAVHRQNRLLLVGIVATRAYRVATHAFLEYGDGVLCLSTPVSPQPQQEKAQADCDPEISD